MSEKLSSEIVCIRFHIHPGEELPVSVSVSGNRRWSLTTVVRPQWTRGGCFMCAMCRLPRMRTLGGQTLQAG